MKTLSKKQKNELRAFLKRLLSRAEIYYPKDDEAIVLDYGELGQKTHSTVELKRRIEEILEEL